MSGDLERDELETFQVQAAAGLLDANAVTEVEADSAGRVVRILILEDQALGAELAQRLLVRAGLSFTAAVVGTRASFVEQLAAFRPDVILSEAERKARLVQLKDQLLQAQRSPAEPLP